MTLILRTRLHVLPEKQKEVLQTLLSLIELPGMDGCLSYDIFGDIEDNTIFSLISEWQSRRQLNRHMSSERFSVLLGTRSLLSEQLKIRIFTVSDMEGKEAVNAVRKRETPLGRFTGEGA
ncbi:MAG: antibiotic biosynthesis monooxygenase family protein [Desulfoprunum sp.]|jgi:quinol monooxygenase YgiN|uniref:putative quinol monooxygenase n=1 Tax=Desulfoprunum sp. TaxID=2020866 RepID=UPI00052B800E|nr:antibiotic biosynthesis monooxygenase [Desulfobulbus sp. Tol-SR]